MSGTAFPAKEETHQLPHRIETQAAGHDRIGVEMTVKKPQARFDIQLGFDIALVIIPTIFGNAGDTIEHQHRGQRQQRVALTENFSIATVD